MREEAMSRGSVSNLKSIEKNSLRYDIPASFVVFLVALPLCLGIALASGAPLFSGIIAGIIGGIIIGSFSGSQISVSGPAAGLTIIVATAIKDLNSFEAFLFAVALSGVFQIIFSLLRAGSLSNYIPNSVIKGMLAAIGIVIILKQIPHALGRDGHYEGDFDFFLEPDVASNTLTDILHALYSLNLEAVIITVMSIIVLLSWEKSFIKKRAWLSMIPAPLLVVILGIIINESFKYFFTDFYLKAEDGHLVTLPIVENFGAFFKQFSFPDFSAWANIKIYKTAFTLALVGSIETLLSIEASDKLDTYRRISDGNKELRAQGLGNIISGLIGGLPITSVIVRSTANVYAGARTRKSTVLHGVLLLLSVILIPRLLNYVPLASLASILIVIGYKLTSIKIYRKIYNNGIDQFLPFLFTIFGIVFIDLLAGVAIGMLVGIFFVIRVNQKSAISVVSEDNYFLVRFKKDLSFINKIELKNTLAALPHNCKVIIDATNSRWIDKDIYDLISDFEEAAQFKDISLEYRHYFDKVQSLQQGQLLYGKLQKVVARQ
jgi:MFS superfamily sulfate permease-like transporter